MRAATPGVCPTPHATVSLLLSPSLSYHSLSASTFVSSSAYFSGSHLFLCIFLFVSVSFSPCVSLELSIFLGFSPFLFPHSLLFIYCVCVSSRSERLGHREVFPFGECPASSSQASCLSLGVDLASCHPWPLGRVLWALGKDGGGGAGMSPRISSKPGHLYIQSVCRPSACGQRTGPSLGQPRMVPGAGTDHHPGCPGAAHR